MTSGWLGRLGAAIEKRIGREVSRRPPLAVRVALPVVLVVLALVIIDLGKSALPGGGAFQVLLIPLLIAAVTLGLISGISAFVLGAVGALLLLPLTGHPWLSDPIHLARFVLYLLEGAIILVLVWVLRRAVGRAHHRTVLTLPPTRAREPLSSREREVLTLAATGLSTREMATRLFVSENTIKSHLARIYGKLGARNRAEAVSAGLQAGWITTDATPAVSEPEDVV